jgi:hypothetical protein
MPDQVGVGEIEAVEDGDQIVCEIGPPPHRDVGVTRRISREARASPSWERTSFTAARSSGHADDAQADRGDLQALAERAGVHDGRRAGNRSCARLGLSRAEPAGSVRTPNAGIRSQQCDLSMGFGRRSLTGLSGWYVAPEGQHDPVWVVPASRPEQPRRPRHP